MNNKEYLKELIVRDVIEYLMTDEKIDIKKQCHGFTIPL